MSLTNFNQLIEFKINLENRWVKKAELIPWPAIEESYAELFPNKTGMPAKPLHLSLGALIIRKQYDYSDRKLVEQLTENSYYQFFICPLSYQQGPPFALSILVELRKSLTDDILGEINEKIIGFSHPDDHTSAVGSGDSGNTTVAGNDR